MRDNSFIMKAIPILKIAAFSIAFIFSAAFAGLFVDKIGYQPNTISESYLQQDATELQKRIWLFLEEDRSNGAAMNSYLRSSETMSVLESYETATIDLVLKMNRMDDSGLPPDVRAAWQNHAAAWNEQARLMRRVVESGNRETLGDLRDDYRENGEEINRTYSVLLATADEYGVSFRY